ncbi:dihydrolipoyl dehydrogenase [Clostridiaceae bacterium HSG29]|nr:dihydrolipoyl dehydrogenase [Clostridiaceae bacterium HSG29]
MKDIVIIGGGPGGYETAIRAAKLGANVTLIEKEVLGGTCLNRGCIPTKALYRNAEILNNIKEADKFGIDVNGYSLNVSKVQSRKQEIVDKLVSGIEVLIKENKIEYYNGFGSLVDKNTVLVKTEEETIEIKTKYIIIATGSKPSVIPVEGSDIEGIYTSKEILEFNEIPKRLTIIGAGVIGVEFANIFNSFGSEVTLMLRSKNIIKTEDVEISKRLASMFKKKGISILNKVEYKKIEKVNDTYVVTYEDKKGIKEIVGDKLLISAGRSPVLDGIGLEELGIKYTRKGITVDNEFKTNIDNIYAIGDVNGKLMLAHVASHQGIEVVERIMGKIPKINQNLVPNCIFVFPEVSSIGKREEELKEAGIEYNKNKFLFAANGKALTLGEGDGFIKVLEVDNKIVGVHILGPHASDLIHEAAIVINNDLGVEDIARTIHAHPTLSETFVEAVLGLHNEAIHQIKK